MFRLGQLRSTTRDIRFRNEKKFKSLEKTYKMFTFLLVVGMMYPNPKTDKMRQIGTSIVYLLCLPMFFIFSYDMSIRIQNNDMDNMVRQMIIFSALLFANIKSFITIVYKKELREVYDGMNSDYAAYNDYPEEYQKLVEETIRKSKFLEAIWTTIVSSTGVAFPGTAIILNMYSFAFTDTPRRYMLHECYVWGLTAEQQYSSPIYEIFFLYSSFVGLVIFLGFSGFDGMFSVSMFHLSLKIKILSMKLKECMENTEDLAKFRVNLACIVREQYEVFDLKDKLLRCYEVWLALIFVLSVTQTGMALTQITSSKQGGGANLIFIMFLGTCAAHIFFPCYITTNVTHTAASFADILYATPWEDFTDPGIRRSILFMITRAQKPMNFKALNLLTFNMEMFVSVMQTAYSMFTLLRK